MVEETSDFTVFCLSTGVYSCGGGEDEDGHKMVLDMPQLGRGEGTELVPRMKKVIGTSTGDDHTVAWTEEGELFTFGNSNGDSGQLATEKKRISLFRGLSRGWQGRW